MKSLIKYISEQKGDIIDDQWIQDEKPVMTKNGYDVKITDVDISVYPNVITGNVYLPNNVIATYKWTDDGNCIQAADNIGNPKQPDENDALVKK